MGCSSYQILSSIARTVGASAESTVLCPTDLSLELEFLKSGWCRFLKVLKCFGYLSTYFFFLVKYEELKALIENNKDLVLIDVRSQGEVAGGRIPGAIHIPSKT